VRGGKCIYCRADLRLTADQRRSFAVDLLKGVPVRISTDNGPEKITGTLTVDDRGLRLTGSAQDSDPVAFAVLAQFLGPGSNDAAGGGDGPAPPELLLSWDRAKTIEFAGNSIRIGIAAQDEAHTQSQSLSVLLNDPPGNPDACYAELHQQMLQYRDNPDLMPRCPGCRRILRMPTNHCIYCGERW